VSGPQDRPIIRTRRDALDLRAAWEEHGREWIAWAREPGQDSYWRFHRDLFMEILPEPGRRTLDIGCGEGRLSRDLKAAGHAVVGIDGSQTMIDAARAADPTIPVYTADAAALPFRAEAFDAVVAFMSLQDVDDMGGAVREAARVLQSGGTLSVAIVHPLNSAGTFEGLEPQSRFVIADSYLDHSFYEDDLARDGREMVFASAHRPLEAYSDAIFDAGLLIDRLRESSGPADPHAEDRRKRWQRIPLFLHLRGIKPVHAGRG
jgi:SAM-dependent methyltransferase